MTHTFAGRVALVSGAAHGIGAATVRKLAREGATVVACDVDGDALGKLSEACGDNVKPFVVDLLEDGAADAFVAFALRSAGKADIIVNSAGFSWDSPIGKMTNEQWNAVLAVLATVPFRIARAIAPHFKARADEEDQGGGPPAYRKLVSVAALEGVAGRAGAANYSAANAAMTGLTSTLAREWARFRVTANTVAFGPVQSRQLLPSGPVNRLQVGGYEIQSGVNHALLERLGVSTPAKDQYSEDEVYGVKGPFAGVRPLSIDEAAEVIAYFCSTASDQVSGTMHAAGSPRRF
jgi:3-oxoacyl-[acyl-carrier protein] reductase